jgi:PHP family Zn ribbon phosphoesterase
MKLTYDLHIHSCLSPCSSDDMTPNNIVDMALLKGLDVIAVTDHNTCRNVRAVMACAEGKPICVLPGMELETREEVHMLCLFDSIEALEFLYDTVRSKMPPIKNRKDIFGNQLVMNQKDEVIAEEENLLIAACDLSVDEAIALCRALGGVIVPAHIDRPANSIVSNLGFIPPEYEFSCLEVSRRITIQEALQEYQELSGYTFLQNSDAHMLEDILEPINTMQAEAKTAAAVIHSLKYPNFR